VLLFVLLIKFTLVVDLVGAKEVAAWHKLPSSVCILEIKYFLHVDLLSYYINIFTSPSNSQHIESCILTDYSFNKSPD